MSVDEGVVKHDLDHTEGSIDEAWIQEINAWREICYEMGFIGQDPERYDGYGFGNISARVATRYSLPPDAFVITGTQTGHYPKLTADHYVLVTCCDTANNRVVSQGPVRPSAESLTHGTIYELDATVRCVIHAHSPAIWSAAAALGIPTTRADVAYGTPAMAAEMERLFAETDVRRKGILAMAGHQDGIVTFASCASIAGRILTDYYARARQLEDRSR